MSEAKNLSQAVLFPLTGKKCKEHLILKYTHLELKITDMQYKIDVCYRACGMSSAQKDFVDPLWIRLWGTDHLPIQTSFTPNDVQHSSSVVQ